MSRAKQYVSSDFYEKKLDKVMARFGIEEHNHNFDRFAAWVEFRYKGTLYRFEHSVEKAKEHQRPIQYGSDAFAQIVLALEDLSRMVEMGIYDLATWVAGMRYLPPPTEVPHCFKVLGFETMPASKEDVKERYRHLAKLYHPDTAKDKEKAQQDFEIVRRASEDALRHFEKVGR